MDHQRKIALCVVATVVIAFTVGFVTDELRESVRIEWKIEIGDDYVFSIGVEGYSGTGSTTNPPPFAQMNNSRIRSVIISLPNITIFMRLTDFGNLVIRFPKTLSTFENGSEIPLQYYRQINDLVSRCILPVGNWEMLDACFPDTVELANDSTTVESYFGADFGGLFRIGFTRLTLYQGSGWFGDVIKTSGVPNKATFWAWSSIEPYIYSYNVTLTLLH